MIGATLPAADSGRSAAAGPSWAMRGVTLIELLITILVISIGLLGLAGMQNLSLQYNHASYQRTNANAMAYDIADRMRANGSAATKEGAYNIAKDDPTPNGGSDCGDLETIAKQDLCQWRGYLDETLPDVESSINVDSASGVATITIEWNDDRSEEAEDDVTTFTVRTGLRTSS